MKNDGGKWWAFSTAIESTGKWSNGLRPYGALVAREIENSQKFFIPCGSHVSNGRQYDDFADLLHLPFDHVAVLSATTFDDSYFGVSAQGETIAVAVNAEGGPNSPAFKYIPADKWAANGDPWFLMFTLTRFRGVTDWWVPMSPAVMVGKADVDGKLALRLWVVQDHLANELLALGMSTEKMSSEAQGDIHAVVELCLLLGVQNVKKCAVPPPVGVAKKRAASGKAPLYTYHVLEVDGEVWDTHATSVGRTSTGLRSHLRRGHIRRLVDGRRTWVRACFVHGSTDGFVNKDYSLAKAA